MRIVWGMLAVAFFAGSPADAFQQCSGNPPLRVFWEKSILQVGDTYYKMHKEKLGKKSVRLTGHNMIFVRSGGKEGKANTFIRGGFSVHCSCTNVDSEDNGLNKVQVVPYVANTLGAGGASGMDPDAEDRGNNETAGGSRTHGGGHGNGHGKKG